MKLAKRLLALSMVGLLFMGSGCTQNTSTVDESNTIALDNFEPNLYNLDFMALYQQVVDIAGTEELVWSPSYYADGGIDLYFTEDGTIIDKFNLSFVANHNSTPYNYFVKQYEINGQTSSRVEDSPIDSFEVYIGSVDGPFERSGIGNYRSYGAYDTFKKFMQFMNDTDWSYYIDTFIKDSYHQEPVYYNLTAHTYGVYMEYEQLKAENRLVCFDCSDIEHPQLLDELPEGFDSSRYIQLSPIYYIDNAEAYNGYTRETDLGKIVLFEF